ncbi:MAG: Rrf2 family transcriptional regulator [Polynucleobacter sp.]|nr:Rrf2 family transcriptional regulator [Polynucleobacter sp.]
MKITTKSRYAVEALVSLASQSQGKYAINLQNISKQTDISVSYLEQIFSNLKSAQLIDSHKGPGGGYWLTRAPEAVSIGDIMRAVDQAKTSVEGMDGAIWRDLALKMESYMDSISLATLLPQTPPDQEFPETNLIHKKVDQKKAKKMLGKLKPMIAKSPQRMAKDIGSIANSVFNWGGQLNRKAL